MSSLPGSVSEHGVLGCAFVNLATQMVDSTLETTRVFWRHKMGLPETIVVDPRPVADAIAAYEAENEKAREAGACGLGF